MAEIAGTTKLLGHMVYFKLKESSPASIQNLISDCKKYLTGHPGIVFFGVGTVAPDLDRPVNDRDFDVALQVVFDSRTSHDVYQQAPRHLEFVHANKETWAKVRVFDAEITC